jgi:phospholipid/cholesterol/gamma-HCH transport system substrate-binding protein
VEIFADKLARHPELIGIGGAIRPSSGLKESPSVIPYRVYPGH